MYNFLIYVDQFILYNFFSKNKYSKLNLSELNKIKKLKRNKI